MFITLEEFKARYFGESKHPSLSTVRRWARDGDIPTRKIRRCFFVDVIAFEANGNPVLEKVLRDVARAA
jgi:hypothetical protein